MDKLFFTILNMSLTGAFVIAAICLMRLPLKKAPKTISYCLWAVAGFRLAFPFSFESIFSLIPFNAQTIPPAMGLQSVPQINSGIVTVDSAVNDVLAVSAQEYSMTPTQSNLQAWTSIGEWIWIAGMAAMIVYGVASYIILMRKMRQGGRIILTQSSPFVVHQERNQKKCQNYTSPLTRANIYESETVKSPFVLGILKPKIYLPVGLSATEMDYIILHERSHIKRRDHIAKLVAYFILCIHWFNPMVWVAFLLMSADMEMSCDEHVLNDRRSVTKKDYSMSLLSLATGHGIIGVSPLAFGEGGVKARIKNVLNFRKPSRGVVVIAVACVALLSAGFALNRTNDNSFVNISVRASDVSAADDLGQYRVPTPYADYTGDIYRYRITLKYYTSQIESKYLPLQLSTTSLTEVFSKKITAEEYLRSFVFENQGSVVSAEIVNFEYISNMDPSITKGYEINESGQTYGNGLMADELGYEPDLMEAMGVDGTSGYVYTADMRGGPMPSNPKEALTRQLENAENAGKDQTIPLYESDGKTVIGEFFIGGQEFSDEEIQQMIDAVNQY